MTDIITIENLHFAYPLLAGSDVEQRQWVLRGVNLTVAQGQFVVLMGPTGVGKSTLCLALNGMLPQSTGGFIKGDVTVEGFNTKHEPVANLARQVGLVFQEPETQLFNMSVETEVAFGLENLGLARPEMFERIEWALEAVGMSAYRERSPFQLSGGQQQRIAIASIIAMLPRVLVLDEPTASLDPQGQAEVFAVINDLRRREGMTIIMVTQQAESAARFAERVVLLEAGRITLDGSPAEVFAQVEHLRQIGLAAPQVSRVAHTLNQQFNTALSFTRLDEAQHALTALAKHEALSVSEVRSVSPIIGSESGSKVGPARLEARDVWFAYDQQAPALCGVSLAVAAGELVAIIGQNGSGKTTLAKHFNGLLRPSQGQVLHDGSDIAGRSAGLLARKVGYVFQNPDHQIFSATVRDEIAFGPRNLGLDEIEVEQRIDDALARFGLQTYAAIQPAVLGFGLRRKVSVAAVYAMQTPALILDEPTSGLDFRSASELMALLAELCQQGRSVVLISHDMGMVGSYAPRCVVMRDGEIVADGRTRAIFAQADLLREAAIAPPQVTQLAGRLGDLALPGDVLTVEEFCRAYAHVVGSRREGA